VLCGQLAFALDKEPKDFKAYQSAVKDVEKAKKEHILQAKPRVYEA
jgi:hypothetical protein